jgi:hypothetical protein
VREQLVFIDDGLVEYENIIIPILSMSVFFPYPLKDKYANDERNYSLVKTNMVVCGMPMYRWKRKK